MVALNHNAVKSFFGFYERGLSRLPIRYQIEIYFIGIFLSVEYTDRKKEMGDNIEVGTYMYIVLKKISHLPFSLRGAWHACCG
jgi:hypothetical protein